MAVITPSFISQVPGWLELPPRVDVEPPVDTLAEELPIGSLRWDDFERLCLRLARTETDVVGARLYGTPGQSQQGIDLFAHVGLHGRYRVYQCKRVEELEPAIVVAAVDEFLGGDWVDRADELVLCSSSRLRTVQREEAFEQQRLRLAERGVRLLPWTSTELSDLLRVQPSIVHDFFGQPWVARFCGKDAATTTSARLSPRDVHALRDRLRALYRTVFAVHDTGMGTREHGGAIPLEERYVVHDVLETTLDRDTAPSSSSETGVATESVMRPATGPRQRRLSLEEEILTAPTSHRVVLGGPGSGKSALLRYVVLDLLNEAPRLGGLARAWGQRVPIWIPFGAWLHRIEHEDRSSSIADVVRSWLMQWGVGDLYPLVEQAIRDKSLLLLVDGFDEWTSEETARLAIARLRVFAELQETPIVLTSRPRGFRLLSSELPGWREVELAPLSHAQQLTMSERWYAARLGHLNRDEDVPVGSFPLGRVARDALIAIQQLPGSGELTSVPLLLSILLVLRSQNTELPTDRFRAYAEITKHLMHLHPKQRALSAQQTMRPRLADEELERAYAFLAYKIQQEYPGGIVPFSVARSYLEYVLRDEEQGLGLSDVDSKRLARELLEIGESVSSLLVKTSPNELGFYHRSIQEHLAARHLSSCAEAVQLSEVERRAGDPNWRDVLLGLACHLPSQESVGKVIRCIEATPRDGLVELDILELLVELSVTSSHCANSKRTALIESAFVGVEEGWSSLHRTALLNSILQATERHGLKSAIASRVRRWFPERAWHRAALLRSLRAWPEAEAWPLLRLALLNDDLPSNQIAAADVISSMWPGDAHKRGELLRLAYRPYSPSTRGAIIKGLLDGWGPDEDVQRALDADGSSLSSELRLVRILARLRAAEVRDDDREALTGLMGIRGASYEWREVIRNALLANWPKDLKLRDTCLKAVRSKGPLADGMPWPREAWPLLLEGYPMDDAVAAAIIEDLDERHQTFASVDWFVLGRQFRGHKALGARLEEWIEHAEAFHEPQIAAAAVVGTTPRGKQILLSNVRRNSMSFWAARGLVEGWGVSDPEVGTTLREIAMGENLKAGWIAHLLPRVIDDRSLCRERLLELISDMSVDRPDFVVAGLEKLGALERDDDFVARALHRIGDRRTWREGAVIAALVRTNSHDERVRALALRELQAHDGAHTAVAQGFAHDASIRERLAEFVTPLNRELRLAIANHFLRHGLKQQPELTEIFREYVWEHDPETATTTSLALHRALESQRALTEADIERLRIELSCYGDRYEARRQAGYVGALEVGRYELIDEKQEEKEATPLWLSLGKAGEPNRVLIREVLAHWPQLQSRYPGKTLARLQNRRRATGSDDELNDEAWAQIADSIELGSELDHRIDDWFPKAEATTLRPSLLRYLARHEPGSRRLREHCLRVLAGSDRTWDFEERIELAAEILSAQFAADESLWRYLQEQVRDATEVAFGQFACLARVHPTCAAVQERAGEVRRNARSAPVYFWALCATGTADELLAEMGRYWGRGERVGVWLYAPLVQRLKRDVEVLAAVQTEVESHERNAARVSLSIPLSATGPLTDGIIGDFQSLLERELSGDECSGFTYDARSGNVRPMALVLAEILKPSPG